MKKLLLVLAIGAFAACGDSSTESDATVDSASSMSTVDSTTVTPDTTSMTTDTTAVRPDSAVAPK